MFCLLIWIAGISHGAALRSVSFNARMLEFGMDPVASTPEQFDAFVRREIAKRAPVVKSIGATAD